MILMDKKLSDKVGSIIHISREYGRFIEGGGLKDSIEGLCRATAKSGVETHVFLPFPRKQDEFQKLIRIIEDFVLEVDIGYLDRHPESEKVLISTYEDSKLKTLKFHFLSANLFKYNSEGNGLIERESTYTYTLSEAHKLKQPELFGKGHLDFFEFNVLFVKATLHAIEKLRLKPDLIRCHDGHTAILPLIAKHSKDNFSAYLANTPTLTTIHNASDRYRGEVPYSTSIELMCGTYSAMLEPCIHNGKFEPILAAALFGTEIHTVSENYAREIHETSMDWHNSWIGHKLSNLGSKMTGITHGIDVDKFSQLSDVKRRIVSHDSLTQRDLEEKRKFKKKFLQTLGFYDATVETPLLTFVGRFAYQKGFLILAHAIRELFAEDKDVLLVANGSGYWEIIEQIKAVLGSDFEDRLRVVYEYKPQFASAILLAGDFCIIPSLFEPCGQIDFIAQLNGNIPVVHGIGGLVKVEHGVTGFSYVGGKQELLKVTKEAIKLFRRKEDALKRIQVKAVEQIFTNFTWDEVYKKKYLPLYSRVIDKAKPSLPY
jgi:starch synthase